jgi:hypothetical protein
MQAFTVLLATGAVTLLAGAFSPALGQRSAQRIRASPEVGVRGGRDFSVDRWTAGAHLRVPVGRTLELRPSGDFALDDLGDDFQINGDLALHGPADQAYIGAGIGYVNRPFENGEDSGTGLNLFLGFRPIPRRGNHIYLEGRWTFVHSETIFRIGLGVAFPL